MITARVELIAPLLARTLYLPDGAGRDEVWCVLREQVPSSLCHARLVGQMVPSGFCSLRLLPWMCGGKGGFGSQLRAQGGRMGARRKRGEKENKESCRNLDGRRLRVVTQAKEFVEYLETRDEKARQEAEEKKARWRKALEEPQVKRIKFDDHEYLEQREELISDVKRAAQEAMARLGHVTTPADVAGSADAEGSTASHSDASASKDSHASASATSVTSSSPDLPPSAETAPSVSPKKQAKAPATNFADFDLDYESNDDSDGSDN